MTIRNDVAVDWDASPRIITVLSNGAESTEITIQDLHDTCRALEDQPDSLVFDYLVDSTGKEPLGGNVYVGITMTLNNAKLAFEARDPPTFVQCNVSGGNLTAVDHLGADMDPIQTTAYTQVVRTSSSSATLQELESIQYSSYNGGITIDVTGAYSGTEFPVGTPQQPVNNLPDALTIASERGFMTIFVLGDLTITGGHDCANMMIIGESMSKSEITIDAEADVTETEFYDAYVKGILDGNALLKNCRIDNLAYISGYIEQCVLDPGIITLSGTDAHFLDCWSGIAGPATPTIDMGGSGINLALRNYNGSVKIQNKTGPESVSIDLNSGHVVLDETVTNGDIVIRGLGKLTDNSDGATVDATNFFSGDGNIADLVWDEPRLDHVEDNTFGKAVHFFYGVEGGRWQIVNNQMIYYGADNVTEICRFNLYDINGQPTMQNVFERYRV